MQEKSCGAIIYRQSKGETQYLLVQQRSYNWGFPKGHVEGKETEDNGLYYNGYCGLRFGTHHMFFIDLEALLFDSALFATKTTTQNKKDFEEKSTDIYIDSSAMFSEISLSFGLKI